VLLLALVAFGVPLALSLRNRVDAEVRFQAASQADILASTAGDLLDSSGRSKLSTLVREGAASVRGRVIVVDSAGRVLADSGSATTVGQSYAARPEIAAALAGRNFQKSRRSDTLSADILATATPIRHNGKPAGAVRVTQSIGSVHSAVRKTIGGLALIGAVVLLLGLAAGVVIAGQVARPLARLNVAVRRIASGDLTARAPVEGSSEQRSLARSFNEMTERLAGALSAQRSFVADASHQLRTPLTGLRLRIEEAQAVGVSPSADRELEEGLREVDRLAEMVDELLVLSRAGERPTAAAQIVPLADAADRAVARWRAAAEERGLRVSRGPDERPASASCYPADVDRALDSLMENAVQYSDPGGEVLVLVSAGSVEVLDRGRGLAPGEEAEVFERFHRGHAGRAGESGTGLGLAIARELARRWGGDAALAPRSGGGVRATLTYPAIEASRNGGERDEARIS
jgi:two-component system, OmpR family, sensor kinase